MTDPKFTPAALKALIEGDIENFVVASTPGGIEAQEARGQRELVKSSMLPFEMTVGNPYPPMPGEGFWHQDRIEAWKLLESWGVKFGFFDSEKDALFVPVILPGGWQKILTEHSMWSRLLDEQARWRASIFYKAAFYDRKAHMNLETRISVGSIYSDQSESPRFCSANIIVDRRGDDPTKGFASCITLFESAKYNEANFEYRFQAGEKARQEATEWVDKNFPEWRNPGAYWDEEIKGECYGTSD